MRRAEQLITQIRRQTENVKIGISDGIDDEEFLQYLNDGQDAIYGAIMQANAKAFAKVHYIDSVRGTPAYDLAADIYLRSRVICVEYSPTGLEKDFYKLEKRVTTEKIFTEGVPRSYHIQTGQLVISSVPERSVTRGFRVTYDPILPRLDKRRTTVSAVTTLGGAVTALTLATASPFSAADYTLFDHLSFVDSFGNLKCAGLHFSAVNSGTGVVTISGSSHTLAEGETITNGDYVLLGKRATTTCQLPDSCESYLLAYGAMRIFARDSSTDIGDQAQVVSSLAETIISNFQDTSGDTEEVPVYDYDYYPEC